MDTRIETDFVENLGLILQNDGLPRIAGRLLGIFVLHGGPFSFQDLSEKLQVSRGSISTNTRLLVDLGAIEKVGIPGERQDHFRLSPQPYAQLIARWIARSRKAQETINRTSDALPVEDDARRHRVDELSHFYNVMARASESALEELRKHPELVESATGKMVAGE